MPDRWPRAMDASTAAEYLGMSETMLRRTLPNSGKHGVKRVFWLKEDLDKYLDRQAGRTAASAGGNIWDS